MKSTLLTTLFSAVVALASFGPNIRIDHQNNPEGALLWPAIAVGPSTGSVQPVYVVFQYDSTWIGSRADVMFQKSTDAGRTWLPTDVIARRGDPGAGEPDITTDPDGNIYVVYYEHRDTSNHLYCVLSTDGGAMWSQPTKVDDRVRGGMGLIRIAADSAGYLLCAWNDSRTGSSHIWSSVSTDRGATWSQNVRVDEDTTNMDCAHADVFVQPGTNHYLVAASVPYYDGHSGGYNCYLYRSTDMGQTFQPGVRLDTSGAAGPHVVADAQHVVCDYIDGSNVEARTLYTQPDTWGTPHSVGSSWQAGGLAISADGLVHAVLQARPPGGGPYYAYYAFSSDHGFSWSDLEPANNDTNAEAYDPAIAADSAGHVYIVWRDLRTGVLWFATNNPAAIAEEPMRQPISAQPSANVVRGVLFLAACPSASTSSLLDISGREVMDLKPGANDVSRLSPGVYFIKGQGSRSQRSEGSRVTKVVVTR